MPALIIDEFTHLNATLGPKKIFELRRKRDGLCLRCRRERVNEQFCSEHAAETRERARARNGHVRRNLRALSYAAGGGGASSSRESSA